MEEVATLFGIALIVIGLAASMVLILFGES